MAAARLRQASMRNLDVVAILLSGFGLRLTLLGQRSLWYDEAFSIFLSEQSIPEIIRGTAADIQPPLYYILLHFWQRLGEQLFVLRFLSVVFSLLAVALIFALSRRLFARRTALLSALFATAAPFQVAYAQELRMYALLEFLLLIYFYALVKLDKDSKSWGTMLLFGVSGAAALYTQSLALLTWIVPLLYLVYRRNEQLTRPVMIGLGIGFALFLPWLAVLATQMQSVQRSYWIPPPGVAELIQFLLSSTTNLPLPDWMLPIALFITLSAVLFVFLGLRGIHPSQKTGLALVFALWLVPPLLMFIVSYVVRSVFIVRGVILSSLALTILLGWWIAGLRSMRAQFVFASLWVVAALAALYFQLSYDQFPRSPYAQASAYLRSNAQPGDAIIHDNKMTYFPMHYYDRKLAQTWIADPPNAGSNTLAPATMSALEFEPTVPDQAANGKARIWFVIFERALSEAAAQGHEQANLVWMQTHFNQVALQRFNDLYVYSYQK